MQCGGQICGQQDTFPCTDMTLFFAYFEAGPRLRTASGDEKRQNDGVLRGRYLYFSFS